MNLLFICQLVFTRSIAITIPKIKSKFKKFPTSYNLNIKNPINPTLLKNPLLELPNIKAKLKKTAGKKINQNGKYNPLIITSFKSFGSTYITIAAANPHSKKTSNKVGK